MNLSFSLPEVGLARLLVCVIAAGVPGTAISDIDCDRKLSSSSNVNNFLADIPPMNSEGDINVVIEIPAGTTAKWEVTKPDGTLEWEIRNGVPRIVDYLAYPANYGMISQTLLPKSAGGDGDPLDAVVIGPSVCRGTVVAAKLIGILRLVDRGERDDKLIAVLPGSPIFSVNSTAELDTEYPGVGKILETWFSNYKGASQTYSNGFGSPTEAREILNLAIAAYEDSSEPKQE